MKCLSQLHKLFIGFFIGFYIVFGMTACEEGSPLGDTKSSLKGGDFPYSYLVLRFYESRTADKATANLIAGQMAERNDQPAVAGVEPMRPVKSGPTSIRSDSQQSTPPAAPRIEHGDQLNKQAPPPAGPAAVDDPDYQTNYTYGNPHGAQGQTETNLITERDANGVVTGTTTVEFQYADQGGAELRQVNYVTRDSAGNIVDQSTSNFDAGGTMVSSTGELKYSDGRREEFTYSESPANMVTGLGGEGNYKTTTYGANGAVTSKNTWSFEGEGIMSNGSTRDETITYDANGRPETRIVVESTADPSDAQFFTARDVLSSETTTTYTRDANGDWQEQSVARVEHGAYTVANHRDGRANFTDTSYKVLDPNTGQMVAQSRMPDGTTDTGLTNYTNDEDQQAQYYAAANSALQPVTAMEEVDNSELSKAFKECGTAFAYFVTDYIVIYNLNSTCNTSLERVKASRENSNSEFYLLMNGGKDKDDRAFYEGGEVNLGGQKWQIAKVALPDNENSDIKYLDFYNYDFNNDSDPLSSMVKQLKTDRSPLAIEIVDMQCTYLESIGSPKAIDICGLRSSLFN